MKNNGIKEKRDSKPSEIDTIDGRYLRIPIKTNVITEQDRLEDVLNFIDMDTKEGDTIFISEKVVSILQSRMINADSVTVGKYASFLSRYVSNTPGSNLSDPRTMQVALDLVGPIRITFAAGVAAITKLLGIKGMFYRIAGDEVRGLDAPDEDTIEPYNKYISLTPNKPNEVAAKIKFLTGLEAVIIDANYRGVNVLGKTNNDIDDKIYIDIFRDNPLGQEDEQTPLAVVRKIK